ncbi:hypothetical protein KDN24_06435 [Bacillus sp. Bva_UNVM-123]|uniref:hypothetical protein n=1 Tax=Bacillus sp. Bva_UNVM-123 TaxID=2829798 RepID=UPI00391F7523
MKKIAIVAISVIVTSIMLIFTFGNPLSKAKDVVGAENASPKDVIFEGKTHSFETLKELEKETSIIVRGSKIEEEGAVISRSEIDGSVNNGYTKTIFNIDEVYKNNDNNEQIKSGNKIIISEPAYYDKETNTTYRVNGYENMVNENEYILFLIPVDEGMFSPRGVTFGKVPLNTKEIEAVRQINSYSNDDSLDIFINLFNEVREKYSDK